MADKRHEILRLRTSRVCATPDCDGKPEAKQRLCLKCQLEGRPDPPRRPNRDAKLSES